MTKYSAPGSIVCGLRSSKNFAVLACGFLGLLICAAPATAQRTSTAGTDPPSRHCRVYVEERVEALAHYLRADCRGRSLLLGRATSFEAIDNETLDATVVDMKLGSERRILLLSFRKDGVPIMENLTGQIALMAGRGPMSAIEGVDVDLTAFAAEAVLRVAKDGERATTVELRVADHFALEQARLSRATAE